MAQSHCDDQDAFVLVSQVPWEREVIWDSDLVRQKVLKTLQRPSIAGWIPVDEKRTAPDFIKQLELKDSNDESDTKEIEEVSNCNINKNKKVANGQLKSSRKRKRDSGNDKNEVAIKKPSTPSPILWVSTLHEENRYLISTIWEDDVIWDAEAMSILPESETIDMSSDDETIIIDPSLEEDTNDSGIEELKALSVNLNISNDEYYETVNRTDTVTNPNYMITHSVPASRLHYLCFPYCIQKPVRPLLTRSRYLAPKVEHEVHNCTSDKSNNESSEVQTSEAQNDLSKYLISSVGELTARTGKLVLMEYSEENPPLMMRVGMGSQIFNYYHNKQKDKNYIPKAPEFVQNRAVSESPFIGDIGDGKSQMALETKMFRAPIWQHNIPDTDFLVIISENGFYIREVKGVFAVGQQLPLREVPRPRTKPHYDFSKQFAKKCIYDCFNGRKYMTNLDTKLQKAFPNFSKHWITNVLRLFTHKEVDRYKLKSDIPFDNQINHLLTPEDCCAYYSTIIAETSFKEKGYGDRLYLNENCDNKIDEELMTAPWNTTVSYIASLKQKKWLNVSDYNEDGSIVFANQSYKDFKDRLPAIKRCQPLSERSIKRLTLPKAQEWLINYGMKKDQVKRMKNVVECQEFIRDLSEKLQENGVTLKTSRTKNTTQQYKLECQKIFDLQSRVLSSTKDHESDDSDDDVIEEEETDEEIEDMGNMLEQMIETGKNMDQIEFENEEKERLEFVELLKSGFKDSKANKDQTKQSFKGKVLKIQRTYDFNGKKETRTEIVHKREVIETYVRIRQTKSDAFIRNLSFVKNHSENGIIAKKSKSKNSITTITKAQPKSVKNNNNVSIVNDMIDDNDENIDINGDNCEPNDEESEQLVEVVGVKLKFSKSVVQEANQMLVQQEQQEKKQKEEEEKMTRVGYFTTRSVNRMRVDPMVRLRDIFDNLIVKIRKRQELDENIDLFDKRVREKDFPDYYQLIKDPIFLQDIRQFIRRNKYTSREVFLKDIHLIYENSLEYNGDECEITEDALKMYNMFKDELNDMAKTIEPLEAMVEMQQKEHQERDHNVETIELA